MKTVSKPTRVVIGVDTHAENHVAAAFDELGRELGSHAVAVSARGYRDLISWSKHFGAPVEFGIEGTGCYGKGLTQHLRATDFEIIEVNRPNRQHRRRYGKSDVTDAKAAARAVLSGEANAVPKSGDGSVEAIRMLRITKQTALKARTQAINTLKSILVTAPTELHDELAKLTTKQLVAKASRFRVKSPTSLIEATKLSLRSLALRYQELSNEIAELKTQLESLTKTAAPELCDVYGVGTDVAAALLITAGDNPERFRSEAAFASLCGTAPIDCSSGKQQRHRLSRGGDRQANAALHRIVVVRMRWHEPTRAYVERRQSEGKTKREIMRCLKRYVAREIFPVLVKSAT